MNRLAVLKARWLKLIYTLSPGRKASFLFVSPMVLCIAVFVSVMISFVIAVNAVNEEKAVAQSGIDYLSQKYRVVILPDSIAGYGHTSCYKVNPFTNNFKIIHQDGLKRVYAAPYFPLLYLLGLPVFLLFDTVLLKMFFRNKSLKTHLRYLVQLFFVVMVCKIIYDLGSILEIRTLTKTLRLFSLLVFGYYTIISLKQVYKINYIPAIGLGAVLLIVNTACDLFPEVAYTAIVTYW